MKINLNEKTNNKKFNVGVAPLGDPLPQRNTQNSNLQSHTSNLKDHRGITLIALIITIIILLILAVVSIKIATGEGIITKSKYATEESRAAAVEEQRDLWNQEKEVAKYDGTTAKTLSELLTEMQNNNMITEEEKTTIEETGSVTIGTRTITFEDKSITTSLRKPTDEEISEMNITFRQEEPLTDEIEAIIAQSDSYVIYYMNLLPEKFETGNLHITGDIYTVGDLWTSFVLVYDQKANETYGYLMEWNYIECVESYYGGSLPEEFSEWKKILNYKENKIYKHLYTSGFETDAEEYTDKVDISLDDFSGGTIYSQSYLEEVIKAFNQ